MSGAERPRPFVDSNIWLYALVEGPDTAKTALARELLNSADPVVSPQVIHEVCANLLRKARFSEESLREVIAAFYRGCTVVDPVQATLEAASSLRERYKLSYWDSTILASALESATLIWTEDMQHGLVVDDRLRLVNPFRQPA